MDNISKNLLIDKNQRGLNVDFEVNAALLRDGTYVCIQIPSLTKFPTFVTKIVCYNPHVSTNRLDFKVLKV